ncbi:peptidoglycan-binding domain-containing protein [Aureisphaera galaxeae]|uniref:peptidoglycan-binding domain-containing protein n=1 Tax=Aureisphaera galaxeae TaxID=1538023 RepID=UPI0023510649|nr:peptidoglycan-binding domain-containing protein [Aureisphaera galaxeae]MDC8005179.1 peptidoglycan-binding domain-containing protein [Aureisphaera galaxeae]
MKQIIIFLLLVIIGIMGYNVYSKYKRFSLTEYGYKTPQNLDLSNADQGTLLNYHEAIEAVNGYVITQWSSNKIDVRNPKKDNEATKAAVAEYRKKLAAVSYYETLLRNPKKEPEKKPLTEAELKKQLILKSFYANPKANELRLGEQNALVYEIQRLLIEKGDSIRHDGLFRTETFNALRSFEEKSGLFPDGKLDAITLDYLLR